jgi:hypothetical protein
MLTSSTSEGKPYFNIGCEADILNEKGLESFAICKLKYSFRFF